MMCILCHQRPTIGKPAEVQIDVCQVCFDGCPDCGAVSPNGELCDHCLKLYERPLRSILVGDDD
jgi:hypothetical protein